MCGSRVVPFTVGSNEKPVSKTSVWKRYGKTAFFFHSGVYLSTLSAMYYGIESGVDISKMLDLLPMIDLSSLDPSAGTFALAYLATGATGKWHWF